MTCDVTFGMIKEKEDDLIVKTLVWDVEDLGSVSGSAMKSCS